MARSIAVLLAVAALAAAALATPIPKHVPTTFMVQETGLAFLGPDGKEKERLVPYATNGALSPDDRWLACVTFDTNPPRSKLVIQPRGRKGDAITVPLVLDAIGNGCLPVWAADSKRLLIGENGASKNGSLQFVHRIYELATKRLTEVKLPDGYYVTGWSPDSKRFLAGGNTKGIAWLNADGTGQPEFITTAEDGAYGARLSPDGRRVLFLAALGAPKGVAARTRLYAMNLATKARTVVDEPGVTNGYCWSPDGSKIAYTWQRSFDNPAKVKERETLLITCDADGKNRKTVARRKYEVPENSSGRSSIVFFFEVRDWR